MQRLTLRRLVQAAILAWVQFAPVHAQWTLTPIEKDDVIRSFAKLGPYLFAGSNFGIYRSDDNGRTLRKLDTRAVYAGEPYFLALAVKDGDLLAGTAYGVFRSRDSGATWSRLGPDTLGWVQGLVVKGGSIFALGEHSLLRSDDEGATWKSVDSAFGSDWTYSIAADGAMLYIGASTCAYRSADNGETWDRLARGLEDGVRGTRLTVLAASGPWVMGGTEGSWMFRSLNQGGSWTPVGRTLQSAVIKGIVLADGRIFAATVMRGVHVSADTATTWRPFNEGLSDSDMTSLARAGDYLVAGVKRKGLAVRPISDVAGVAPRLRGPGASPGLSLNPGSILRPGTRMVFRLHAAARVEATLHDAGGRIAARLLDAGVSPGRHELAVGDALPPAGVYVLRLQAGGYGLTRRVLVSR